MADWCAFMELRQNMSHTVIEVRALTCTSEEELRKSSSKLTSKLSSAGLSEFCRLTYSITVSSSSHETLHCTAASLRMHFTRLFSWTSEFTCGQIRLDINQGEAWNFELWTKVWRIIKSSLYQLKIFLQSQVIQLPNQSYSLEFQLVLMIWNVYSKKTDLS